MAYQTSIYCVECEETKSVVVGAGNTPSLVCHSCQQEKEQKARDEYFAGLDKLPIEERIRKIEEWQFDYRHQYVPPPRF